MAYYAALVSLVELLKEISHSIPGHRYPNYLFQKQQTTRLYEKFSHLQVLLENYSPNDEETDGLLERIRDVSCRVELTIESQTPDAACRELRVPDAADVAKYMIEYQISDQIHTASFSISYLARRKPRLRFVKTMRKGFRDVLKLMKQLGSIVENVYQDLEKSKEKVDSIIGEGYMEKSKEDIDSIVIKGYQDLMKLKEDIDSIVIKRYKDKVKLKEKLDAIIGRGHQDLERVKEEVDSIVGKGYHDLLEKLKKEVDLIVEELTMRIKDSHTTHQQEDLQVTVGGPSDDGTTMVVLDEKTMTTIKAQLLGDSSKLEVISIVGMGGIGKTTLARNIFDDKLINNHFDFCVWVTVSQSYHLPNILLAIVKSLNKSKEDLNGVGEELLKERIYKNLFGRRYLIIMDDMWDTKFLDDVKWIFPTDHNGSRIMITTRQSYVASVASASDFVNQISTLTHHQSWTLFREKVFCPTELEDLGRFIVKKCGGLPLAIIVVAGLLKTSNTRDHWGDIARRVSSVAAENDEHFSKILSLSYYNLPHHLKPCFLYMGGFPEDYEISISRLVKLWVAEGFLKPIASKNLEEAAEEYLEELVKRNLVLINKQRSNGKFKSCSMHDLLRDLCLERARHEHFLLSPHKHIATNRIHRFFIHPDSSYHIDMQKDDVHHVRSIISFGDKCHHFTSHPSRFKPLRVLDAPQIHFSFLHDGVFELLNLRFLVLNYSKTVIPSSIFQLQHLQTLIGCGWLCEISLPSEIWEMPRLRHVLVQNLELPPSADGGSNKSGGLPSLQTLSTLVNFTFTSGIAEMIPSIKKLKLDYECCENAWTTFGLINLVHLFQLETLAIKIHIDVNITVPFPESFAFPSNLRKLTLKGCQLPWRNLTVVGTLPHLQVLKLRQRSFVGEEWESKEGEFSRLKFLEMFRLSGIKNWQTEGTHFPCLEHLVIRDCHYLEGIPSEIGEFPNLKFIEVWSHNSRVKASAREIQEEQLSVGNETLQVRVY